MPFRSNPANNVPASGGGDTSNSLKEIFITSIQQVPNAAPPHPAPYPLQGNIADGFLNDGDLFVFPVALTGEIEYRDNTGSLIWTVGADEVFVTASAWFGFMMDESREKLIVVALVANQNRIYLASIDIAGTVTSIGAGVVMPPTGINGSNFPLGSSWHLQTTIEGSLYAQFDENGNVLVMVADSGGGIGSVEGTINVTTGAQIEAFHNPASWKLNKKVFYKSKDKIYHPFPTGGAVVNSDENGSHTITVDAYVTGGFGIVSSYKFLQIGGRVYNVYCNNASASVGGVASHSIIEYDAWLKRLMEELSGKEVA